jgi:hypothetical protein
MLGNSIQDMTYAFILSCMFVFSLFFGWTVLLIHMLMPRGAHRIRRGVL